MHPILKRALSITFSMMLVVCFTTTSFAQTAGATGEQRTSSGPRKHIATIVFAALGGAVLGLSTLSFYGRPQEKLSNIAIGAAFGAIAATAYVTYSAATRPAEFYGDRPNIDLMEQASIDRRAQQTSRSIPLSFSQTFTF